MNAESCLANYRRLRQGLPYPDPRNHHGAVDIALWAVGDTTLADLIAKAPVIFGGLGLAALGAKVNAASQATPQTTKTAKTK